MNEDFRPRPAQPAAALAQPAHHPATHHQQAVASPPQKAWKKILANLKIVLITLLIVGVAALGFLYWHTKQQLNDANNGKSTQAATQDLVDKIGKIAVLPTNETPTTATVNNASKLNSQQFFSHAQNGDKVLIYSKSGQAVLYRPSTNKIVEYTQISFNNSNTP